MVLERILSPKTAQEHASIVLLAGGVVSVVSVLVAYFVFAGSSFESSIGIFVPFFITMAILPFMLSLESYDEAKEENLLDAGKKLNIFQRHKTIIKVFIAFFLGVIISLSIIYMMLPEKVVGKLFNVQTEEINRIRGAATLGGTFSRILRNNVQVLMLSFVFSFVFGAGAIYILAWNSSVLAAAIGITAKGVGGVAGVPLAVLQYFPHGSLEFLAYFIGAIAGGIVSVAITRRRHKHLLYILEDSFKLLVIAFGILVVAALIEGFAIVAS